MITNYSIENFKVFSEKTDLEFAPITLIYGPNSSGKSLNRTGFVGDFFI
ncbi:AAA family ATPase [Acinetobacter baumannii]